MADNTAIEWADATFNPWMGCEPIGPGCDHCYAKRWVERFGDDFRRRQRTSPPNWRQPLAWDAKHAAFFADHGRRRRVFCASLADVFDNKVPPEWRRDLFDLIELTPNLDWLLLTKRIGNVHEMVRKAKSGDWLAGRPNVWLGATVVNQAEADRDIRKLLAVPARKRFLSIEPMLGPIDLGLQCENWSDDIVMDPETGAYECCKACDYTGVGNDIDWVIAGGESGPHARPMHPDWARGLRDQCGATGVPFLFKQWGEWCTAEQLPDQTGDTLYTADLAALCVKRCAIDHTGRTSHDAEQLPSGARDVVYRVGKKAAGRVLDGRTHDGFPEAAR